VSPAEECFSENSEVERCVRIDCRRSSHLRVTTEA